MTQILPLAGYRVVDLADEKGELAGRLLADFGAEVVRVEPPTGARSRKLPPFAPSGTSLYFAYRNANKLGHVLDLESEAGRASLLDLLARADVLIESEAPGRMASLGLDPKSLSERFPHLVVLSISDFGQTGPYRDWVATDATMCSVSGMQFKAGVQGREPLLTPGAMAYDIAGVMGAFAAMTSLFQRIRTGYGQTLDLSVLEAVAQQTDWSFSNGSMTDAKLQEVPQTRFGSGPMYRIFPCKGGFVRLVILSPRQWQSMRAWLGEPEYLQDKKYESFLGRMEIAEALNVMIGDLFATMTHEEVAFEAQKRGIVCTPVLAPSEVLENVHFRSRKTFLDAEYARGERGPVPAGFFEIDRERQGFRTRAPEKGEHSARIAAGLWPDLRPKPVHPRPAPSLPFENLRLLDFGIGGVGVEAARLFAEYGADVIKVESKTYPDFIRTVMSTPLSGSFASSSRSKRGLGINLKTDEGKRLLHELARHADVVTENGSTGTMDSLGVGYEALSKTNPGIVLASSQLLGDHGAWADWIGYGPSTQPIGGLVHLWDYEQGDEPAGSTSIFPDHLAGRLLAISALAALFRRQKTGRGGHASVAQAEAVVHMLGDLLLKEGIAPGTVKPRGNRSDRGAPWGTYPCAGVDQWVTITVRDDSDWAKLKMSIGDPEWTQDARYATAAGRLANQDELDAKLAEWTKARTKLGVTAILQMFKVPCAPMFTARDQLHDPHYQSRGYLRWIDQQIVGWMALEGPCFRASGMSDVTIFQAPLVGEHTRAIARDVLGLSDEEIEVKIAAGVLEALG
ncbi:CoA transferase [Myxococcota bacterium]|nr:CoA transferase [Myxococcota bacterium]